MKKLVSMILILFFTFIYTNNIAYANIPMVASNGDYKIYFITLNPNTFGINEFYYGQRLSNLLSFTKAYTINNNEVNVDIFWENPDYELVNGYQSVNLYFINDDTGNKTFFTVGLYCNTNIYNVKPLRILP